MIRFRTLLGRCSNGYERGRGSVFHVIEDGSWTAICGKQPGRTSAGWSTDDTEELHAIQKICKKCTNLHRKTMITHWHRRQMGKAANIAKDYSARDTRPKLIFAGNYAQAERFAKNNKLQGWRYVDSIKTLQGFERFIFTYIGTYSERSDYVDIQAALDQRCRTDQTHSIIVCDYTEKDGLTLIKL